MLEVSEEARAEFKRMSAECRNPEKTVQRLVSGLYARLQFVPDDTGDFEGDVVVEYQGEPVFVVSEEIDEVLDGWQIVMGENINGKTLCFIRQDGTEAPCGY